MWSTKPPIWSSWSCSDNTNLGEMAWGGFVWDYVRVNCCKLKIPCLLTIFLGKTCDLRTVLSRPTAVVFAAYWAMIMIAPCTGRSLPKWPVWLVEGSIPRIRMTRLIWYFYHIQHIQAPYSAFGGRAMEVTVMAGRHHGGCILLHHLCHFSYLWYGHGSEMESVWRWQRILNTRAFECRIGCSPILAISTFYGHFEVWWLCPGWS